MSIFYRLVLDSVCRSNHHRLAILALAELRGPHALGWRDLFLRHHKVLFEGAKAPDETFKDFKNHVLHVRDGFWGGAPAAAAEWRTRTLNALREEDWGRAAYCAGVMSHYVVDPIHPFHTGQSETENVLHRAVEWSFSKSFKTLHAILEGEMGGAPDLPIPEGPNWLEDMIRAGATAANAHYEAIIDHYDYPRGVRKPEEGLDQRLKDIAAGQIGYAAALLARVLDRTFEEAGVVPPKVNLTLDTIFAGLSVPIRAVLAKIDDLQERALVERMHAEFVRTGKVRATLPADDRLVRALHAEEVLKTPLSSLDCQWPREIGRGHGAQAEPRATPKRIVRAAARPADASHPARSMSVEPPPTKMAPASAPPVAPAPEKARLEPNDPVVDAPSIGPKTAERLEAIGVVTVADLLALSPEEAKARLRAAQISPNTVRDWQDQALLACAVPGLTGTGAQILVACGLRTLEALRTADPANLAEQVSAFCASKDGQRLLRFGAGPEAEKVAAWVQAARGVGAKAA